MAVVDPNSSLRLPDIELTERMVRAQRLVSLPNILYHTPGPVGDRWHGSDGGEEFLLHIATFPPGWMWVELINDPRSGLQLVDDRAIQV